MDYWNFAGCLWSYWFCFYIIDWFLFQDYWEDYNRWARDPKYVWFGKFLLNHSLFDCRKGISEDSYLLKSFFRGADLTKRERNELNDQGIHILNTKAIGYSSQYIYEGESYDELRKVSKFENNHLILETHGLWLN